MQFITKHKIEKGWSADSKYRVTDESGNSYLLRVSPIEQTARKQSEFTLMQRVCALGVPMCRPIDFGTNEEGVYSLQSWIDGDDAETLLPTLPPSEQYRYGTDAGKILQIIHSIPSPADLEPWDVFFHRKIDRKRTLYADCPLKYENDAPLIAYIEESRHLLSSRPRTYQHGDYHIGNMMIEKDGTLVIIDFDRCDYGDPWEEFNRIVWSAEASPAFATGMVNGYFPEGVPDAFWRLLALYIASNTLSSLPWAIPFGQEEIKTMKDQCAKVLSWYQDFNTHIPTWYLGAFPFPD